MLFQYSLPCGSASLARSAHCEALRFQYSLPCGSASARVENQFDIRVSILTPLRECISPRFCRIFSRRFNTHSLAGVHLDERHRDTLHMVSILTPLRECIVMPGSVILSSAFQYSLPCESASSTPQFSAISSSFNTHSLAGVHLFCQRITVSLQFQYSLPCGSASVVYSEEDV